MHRFLYITTYWSKIAEKTQPTLIWDVPLGWPLANFSMNHTSPETSHGAIRWCTFYDPAFTLLGAIPACDGPTDTSLSQRPLMHSVARLKTAVGGKQQRVMCVRTRRSRGSSTESARTHRRNVYKQQMERFVSFIVLQQSCPQKINRTWTFQSV